MIGRSVRVRRVAGRGTAPLWAWAALEAATWVSTVVAPFVHIAATGGAR